MQPPVATLCLGDDRHLQLAQPIEFIECRLKHGQAVLLDNHLALLVLAEQPVVFQVAGQGEFVVRNLQRGDGLREDRGLATLSWSRVVSQMQQVSLIGLVEGRQFVAEDAQRAEQEYELSHFGPCSQN
jgi:hypothetical protein